jgi:hypothetical protein
VRVNEGELDLGDVVPHQGLGTIVHLLSRNTEIRKGIRAAFQQKADADFILGELSIGIGQEGMLNRIARAKMRSA